MSKNRWHRNYVIRRYLYGPFLLVGSHLLYGLRTLIPNSFYRLHRPIFVVGCSRSGTTIFMDWFKQHADLCNWSEAAQVIELDFYNKMIDHLKLEDDADSFDTFRIRFLFGSKTRLTGKKRFVNKHPENSFRLKFIRAIFPDSIFLHVIRDGRAVAVSNERRRQLDKFRIDWPFGQFPKPLNWRAYLCLPPLQQFAHQWIDTISYIREIAGTDLSPSSYLEIFYEDFCENPLGVLQKADEFCGLDPNCRLPLKREPLENKNSLWEKLISTQQATELEEIVGPMNSALGYGKNGHRAASQMHHLKEI